MDSTTAPSPTQPETCTHIPALEKTPGTAHELAAALDDPQAPGSSPGQALQPMPPPCPSDPDCFPDGPRCPTCGTPRAPFPVRLSGILDQALVAQEALSTLVDALETEVLP